MTAKQGRSRTTKATTRRVRDLYTAFLARIGGSDDPVVQAQAQPS
jgi:hypothetical protein